MKRIISFIVCIVLTFVSVCACFPNVLSFAATISISDDDYANAEAVLNKICPELSIKDSDEVSRAEFVSAVTKLLKMPESFSGELTYKDVSADSPYTAGISYALQLGLISNTSLFYPDSPITYSQAIKIIMCALGYGIKAEYMGGYPTGYLMLANEAGLGKTLERSNDDVLSKKEAVVLLFEACMTDMMEASSFGTSYEYSVIAGKTIISAYHHIYTATGIVEANEYTGIYGSADACGTPCIVIDGKSYAGSEYSALIGKNARVFYSDDNKNTIIFAYETGNGIYEYNNDDSITVSGTNISISSGDNSKDVRYTLEADYSLIYNGKYYGGVTDNSILNPSAGTVTFIDNDGNNRIDVISIKSIEFGVVDFVNEFDEKIYDKHKKGAMMDLASADTKYFVSEADGTPVEFYKLNSGDMVGYVISKDKKLCEIIRYSEKADGVFEEKTSDGKIIVGGKEYTLSDYYINNVKSTENLKLGTEVILYLGSFGQVIYVDEFSSSLEYGFFVKAGETTGLDGGLMALICTEDGELKSFPIADKIKYNGTPKSKDAVKTDILALEAKDILLRVIKYSVNAAGEINKIYDAERYSGNVGDAFLKVKTDEARPVLYSDNSEHHAGSVGVYYINSVFVPLYHLNAGAPIIQVPKDEANRMDENYYSAHSTSTLKDYTSGASSIVACYGYDVDKNGANFVLWTLTGASATVGEESASAVIESVTDGINNEGEVVKVIRAYYKDEWTKFYSLTESEYTQTQAVETLNTIKTVGPGDIVQISTNINNEIIAMKLNFSYSGNETLGIDEKSLGSDFENGTLVSKKAGFVAGYIYSLEDSKAMIVRNKDISQVASGSFSISNLHAVSLTRGDIVVVNMNRNRDGDISNAVVSLIKDTNALESFFNAGTEADFIVQRSRIWDVVLTVIYVN